MRNRFDVIPHVASNGERVFFVWDNNFEQLVDCDGETHFTSPSDFEDEVRASMDFNEWYRELLINGALPELSRVAGKQSEAVVDQCCEDLFWEYYTEME